MYVKIVGRSNFGCKNIHLHNCPFKIGKGERNNLIWKLKIA